MHLEFWKHFWFDQWTGLESQVSQMETTKAKPPQIYANNYKETPDFHEETHNDHTEDDVSLQQELQP